MESFAEATEGALKLARKYYYMKHGKANSEIISFHHSFHGRSTGSVKLTGNPHYQEAFGPLIKGVHYATLNDLKSVEALINERTAAIIVEPLQGEGGLNLCHQDFMTGLRQLCDEHDICLILDEVQCGMGRTGTIMTYFQYNILPDIVCLAKGIGCGVPVGAFVANEKYATIARKIGLKADTVEEGVDSLIAEVRKMNEELNIPKSFKDAGIDEKEFLAKVDLLADRAFEDQCTTANPRVPLVSEIKQMLLDSYYGK